MKKIWITLIVVLFSFACNAQKRYPHTVFLKDTSNIRVNAKVFRNDGKPVIVEFWSIYCKPCIDLLNSFKEVYSIWKKNME